MKKRWMVQAFALALTGVLVFGTGTVTYADEKKPVVIGEMVGQDTSDKDNAKNTKEGKDDSGKECDQWSGSCLYMDTYRFRLYM